MPAMERFEPAEYSIPDLHFLVEHLGTSPTIALRKPLAPGTMRIRLEYVLRTVYELEQLRAAEDTFQWAGIDALTSSITRFLEWHDRSLEIRRRGFKDAAGALITHPSMYVWDDNRAYKGGVDADAYDMVRSEILADGSRQPFGVLLAQPHGEVLPDISTVAPWIKAGPGVAHDDKILDEKSEKDKRVAHLRCTICDHQQQYDPKDRAGRRMAMARMMRHLRIAKVSMNRHRVMLTKIAR